MDTSVEKKKKPLSLRITVGLLACQRQWEWANKEQDVTRHPSSRATLPQRRIIYCKRRPDKMQRLHNSLESGMFVGRCVAGRPQRPRDESSLKEWGFITHYHTFVTRWLVDKGKKNSGQQHSLLTCAKPRSIFMIKKSGGHVLDCLRNMDMGPEKGVKYSLWLSEAWDANSRSSFSPAHCPNGKDRRAAMGEHRQSAAIPYQEAETDRMKWLFDYWLVLVLFWI